MRRSGFIGILLVVVFLIPMTSPIAGTDIDLGEPTDLSPYDGGTTVSQSGDLGSGTGASLPVSLNGVVSNVGEEALQITSSSPGTSTVTITDGWTGTDLATQIESLSMTTSNVLRNGNLNSYHSERFLVSSNTAYNGEAHPVPDSWTLYKNIANDEPHPNHGVYEIKASPSGYSGTYGLYLESQYGTSFNHNPNDEVFIGQMISLPWREVYSAQISFRYYVTSTSTMTDKLHLFTKLGGYVTKYHVFESGDQTNTWLTASITVQASSLQGLANRVIELDIGLASDLTGTQTLAANYYAYIDDVQLSFVVRPFPEQIDLKANGTIVWGSTSGSVYSYLPDDANRDCWDWTTGIDFDGPNNDGRIRVSIYGSDWTIDASRQLGLQFPVDIPQGAIITSAWVEMEAADSSETYPFGVRVYVADTDTVSAFTTGLPHLEDRYSWVPTSIDWIINSWITSPDTRYRSPEIGSLVQKVISRPGWSQGNYMCLMIDYMNSDNFQYFRSIKGSTGWGQEDLARLYVEYVIPEPEDHVALFDYQKPITIDHTKVAATLTNFPVLIDLVDTDLKNHVQSNGNDIVFTLNGQPLDHEIEMYDPNYNPTQAHLVAWVKVPTLSSTADSVIMMHYGCDDMPASYSTGVWDNYEIVQHLSDNPTGIEYDSAAKNHHGTSYGNMASDDLVVGKIGDAVEFDSSLNQAISVGQIYTDQWSQFTMSAWVYHDVTADDRVFSKAPSTTSADCIMHLGVTGSGYMRTRLSTDEQSSSSYDSLSTVSNLQWHYLTWTWSSAGTIYLYIDGNLDNSVSKTGTSVKNSDLMFIIANWETGTSDPRNWDGKIDEIRLLPTLLSGNWILTEWRNQNSPSTFYSVGTESENPDVWSDSGSTSVVFTTDYPSPVTMDINLTMDISGNGQTLDENLDPGTSFFIESGSTIVNWTAKVMVSPPAGATTFGFSVEYPMAEWKPTVVLNPFNNIKNEPQDWWYRAGTLTINSSAIDFWGIWTIKFISWNYAQDLVLGKTGEALSTTATFNIGESMKYLATTPTIQGATVGLVLTDPTGSVWYSGANTTGTNPSHRFASFQYREDLAIASSTIYESLTNFPIALDFTDTDLHNSSRVRADGSDIMFAVGDTILPHQIEYFKQDYTVTDARLVVWVCMNLTFGVDNPLSMYYGNPIVDNLQDPEGVWGPDMAAVWHLGEDVIDEGTTGIHYDATGHGYNGVQHGNVETLTSKVGYAQSFDGNDYISFSQLLAPADDVMITGWFRLTSTHSPTSPTTKVIMEKYIDINHDMVIALAGQDYGQSSVPNGSLVFKVESSTNAPEYTWSLGPLGTGTWGPGWYYIGCYANASNPSKNQIFIGSSGAGYDATVGHYGSATTANMSYIEEWQLGGGNFETSYNGTGWFTGQMDEFRVATTYRSENWLKTEWRNQGNIGNYLSSKSSPLTRTSPDHTFTQTLTSTAPAGVWTASIYYNDTGTSVSTRTGLFERTFTVKRDTYLTLTKPVDAVGDRLSVKTAGDAIIVEFELKDNRTDQAINGAAVTINWTSPSSVTLDAYGGGKYGKVMDSNDLADAKRWRVNVHSTHPYYNDANEYFDIDLYHNSGLMSSSIQATPVGYDFTATITFTDSYTGAPIEGATITFGDNSPVKSYVDEGSGVYSVNVSSAALSLGQHTYTLKATAGNTYLKTTTVSVTFTLRAHYTSVSVQGDLVTPYQQNTQVTIILIDLDTGQPMSIGSVSSFSFTSSQTPDTFVSPSGFTVTLTTNDWSISASIQVTLNVTMSSSNFLAPSQYLFTIEIRPHRTSLTISGVVTQPYGNVTPLTVILTDLDNGSIVPIGAVNQMLFQWIGGSQPLTGSYSVLLGTSAWPVGTRFVTVITTMITSAYSAPANYQFTITIRKMATVLYYDPASFVIPNGVDFHVGLRLNISEPGTSYGLPITGRAAGDFSVPSVPSFTLDTTDQSIGRYNLTISASYFPGGGYEIRIYFHSASSPYADASVLIRFTYREIISSLTSPNYPQVTTPYGMNVQITLKYADEDFGTGIEGATISSPDHPTWVYGQVDQTGGFYTIWIDVTGLAQGTHNISITADKAGYIAKTLQFRIVIRAAYTSVVPSVGSLSIPLGSSLTFYADYTDLDRILPIDNNTGDTNVVSTWSRFTVEYLTGIQRYRIIFHTLDTDGISSNVVYTFTFSKGVNYQAASFNITVTIRTHNTDFRLVSSIEPTSSIGTFNISVYYGDLDDAVGVVSSYLLFRVYNSTGSYTNLVIFSYINDTVNGAGFYIIQVPASQFGLGLQSFKIEADWTGPYSKYQDKSIIVTASVIGRESSLTLLIAPDPTPYGGNMTYTFFFSDTGIGIVNGTGGGYVLIYVNFPGETVDYSRLSIIDEPGAGEYSIQLNTTMFSRIGLIYMDVYVNWSKGVAPYYANRTDTISVRVLQRDTLLQTTYPSPASYGENATFTFTFNDITGGLDIPIDDSPSLAVQLSLADYSVYYNSTSHLFTVSFNTDQFGTTLGPHTFTLDVTWSGVPFYASRTGKLVSVTVIARSTFMEYLTPAPTQYMDEIIFNVTWTDITGGASDPISGATLTLYNGLTPIDVGKYSYVEVVSGVYQITLNTTYAPNPGIYQLRVGLNAGVSYITPAYIVREFNIRYRITLLSAEPVATVPYNSSIQIILYYQDLFTSDFIANDSSHSYPVKLQFLTGSNWIYTLVWNPAFQHYELSIATYNQAFTIGIPETLTLGASYANQAPFYSSDDVIVQFELRIRNSALTLTSEPETTPFGDNAQFTIFFADTDAASAGIANAQIVVLNNSVPLVLNTHYTLTQGVAGAYIITVDTDFLGGLGTRSLTIHANWIAGSPYHNNATRVVPILVRQRETSVDVTIPPSQTRYLDDVTFTFVFNDLDAGVPISSITTGNIHLKFANGTEIVSGFTITPAGSSFDVVISSITLSKSPVTGLSLIVSVDWLDSLAPFYADDMTTLKITIVGRSLLVETEQIDRTPKGDTLSIIFDLSDLDNGNPVSGAIILFNCQNVSLAPGTNYDITELAGRYTISVYTGTFSGTGIFLFDVQVRWNPLLSPFYANKTTTTLYGLIDIIRTSLEAGSPTPSPVQITGSVSLIVTYSDLDHAQTGITLATISVQYYGSALPVIDLSINPVVGQLGEYNISFSTSNLLDTGNHILLITAIRTNYAQSQATRSFIVRKIDSSLTPTPDFIQLNWTSSAHVVVFFRNLLTDSGVTGATVTYSILGLPLTGMTPTSTPGEYEAYIDTTAIGSGNPIVTIQADKTQFVNATTKVQLSIGTLPSEMNIIAPTEEVLEVARGDPVSVNITLTDITHGTFIPNVLIKRIYITFRSQQYNLTNIPTTNTWTGTIPGPDTILDPTAYDVRITAILTNFDPAVSQFKIYVKQATTHMALQYPADPYFNPNNPRIEAVYSEIVTFRINFTAPALNDTPITNASVYWYEARWDFNLTFTHIGGGIWELTFNTTQGQYGTWGISFSGTPADPIYASRSVSLTFTIKKITTEVLGPLTIESYDWGWVGNISFFYNDTWFNNGIGNATVLFDYGPFTNLPAFDLGNGTYLIEINTTYLESDTRQRIIVNFAKDNYEERTSGASIFINLRSTALSVIVDDERTYQASGDPKVLEVPMNDYVNVTFFYNDTSPIGGLFGGLDYATFEATLISQSYFVQARNITLIRLGGGYYCFIFDTNDLSLYELNNGSKIIKDDLLYLTIHMTYANRNAQDVLVKFKIISVPTEIVFGGQVDYQSIHGQDIEIYFFLNDTWHNRGVEGAQISYPTSRAASAYVAENRSLGNGQYYVMIHVGGSSGDSLIRLQLRTEFHIDAELIITVTAKPNDMDFLIAQVTQYGLPISFLVILLLGLYVRVWSVPKRIRQINGQIKSLRKNKVPKPISDVKTRSQLIADLFNDTYGELKITRVAAQMPEESIPIQVPEMGELLMQLAILTNLNAEELEEFKGDISKMKMSEQAAFVKEVIMQEAIRAARRDGKTVDETLEDLKKQASARLGGEEAVEAVVPVDESVVETVFLAPEEEREKPAIRERKKAEPKKVEIEEPETKPERMSAYEIEELRKDLEQRGIPPYEIDTILEQARELPRELVEELVKSLEENKKK
jgi:hypothetical protein